MTYYFDDKHEKLTKIADLGDHKGVRDIDAEVVRDVSLACGFDGFPEDLEKRIHLIVLKYSVECQPVNSVGPDYETFDAHVKGIHAMIWDLHTVFHDLAMRRIESFGDDPRTPLHTLYAKVEERREALVGQ